MVCLPFLAYGQTATILGTVTDPSGAVVPNVTITITHVDTGRVTVSASNDAGQFVAPDLPIGHYNVKASVTGFKVAERTGIVLDQGDRTRIDFQLALGTTAQSVSVEANPVAVQTDTGEVSTLVTGQQVTQLATNGRSVYTLVNLTTGGSSLQGDFQAPTPVGGNNNSSFNGNRPAHNLYLMDGGEDDDRGGAGSFIVMPSLDAFAEVQTLTSNYDAQYGLSSGATFQTVLKSGTKTLHASAWEFLRNDALDARNFFNPAPQTVAELRYNVYGFNVGGPVTFGHLYNPEKTKTFFFYNMEWRKLINGGLLNRTVPYADTYGGSFATAGELPADAQDSTKANIPFSGLHVPCAFQLTPALQAVYTADEETFSTPLVTPNGPSCAPNSKAVNNVDPAVASTQPIFAPFTGNVIPTNLINADATALLHAGGKYGGIFPAPTSGSAFLGGNNTPTDVREEVVRIDHNFSDKFTIFGHFVAEQISQGYGTSLWSGDNVPSVSTTFGNPSYSGVVHAAYTINPSLVNEIAFNYNGNRINILPDGLIGQPSGSTFSRFFTGPNVDDRIPNINLQGATGANFNINWQPWINVCNDYQVRDDVSWTKGRHQLKMGGSWALYKKLQDLFTNTEGTYGFNGAFSGNDFADFLLGYAQNYAEDGVQDAGQWNNVSWAAYIQDNYRVNNRLTLNLGLRWDGVPHTYEANNRMSNFYPNLYDTTKEPTLINNNNNIDPSSPGLGTSPNSIISGIPVYLNGIGISGKAGIPQSLVDNHWAAFGPRLGFAYDLNGNGKTVIRGGYGLMYERIQGNDMYNAGPNQPFSANIGTFNNVILGNPLAVVGGTANAVGIPVGSLTGLDSANYRLPTSSQFSLGIQHTIGKSVLSASYVGTQNRHQEFYQEIDLPLQSELAAVVTTNSLYNADVAYPGYHSIKMSRDEANGDYNSLQISMRGSIKSDLTYQMGYTFSHTNDPSTSSGSDMNPVSNPFAGWKYDWGPGSYDHRQIFFTNFVYQIPLLKHSDNHLMKTVVGGWELSGIITAESGAPIDLGVSGGNLCSVVQNCSVRPDLTGSVSYPKTVNEWFNPAAFSAPATDAFGTTPHNYVRGPGRDNWNLSMFKNFVFSESRGSMLQFRAEFFNVWNHTQFMGDTANGGIGTSQGATNFGQITNAYDPRTIQLGLKLIF